MLDSPFDAFEAFGAPFGRRRRDPYAVAGLQPPLVAAFRDGYFRANGAPLGFADLFTFARTGTATYFDSTGTLRTAADGEPRLGHHVYEGGQWVNKGLRIESEARTNDVEYSDDFSDVDYLLNNGAVVQNVVGPDGEANSAWTLSDDNSGGTGAVYIRRNAITTVSTDYTMSCFLKENQCDWALLFVSGIGPSGNGGVYFDLTTGEVGTEDSGFRGAIERAGGGFYRCSMSFQSHASITSGQLRIYMANSDGAPNVDLGGASSIGVFRAQFGPGSTPSSSIPTSGSTATRAAETRSVAAGDWPASTTAMSWYVEGLETYADEGTAGQVTLLDARVDADNRMTLTLDTDGARTGTFTLTVVNGGTSASVSTTNEITPGMNRAFRVACTVTASGLGISLDGTDATAANAAGVPDLSTVDVDYAGMGCRIEERMWGADIGAAGRQAVTA